MAYRPVILGASSEDTQYYKELNRKYGSPLLVFNPSVLKKQYYRLQKALPDVEIYYAIKALPHLDVLKTLEKLGSGFDVASSGELDFLSSLQVSGRRAIHTHPIKRDSDIRSALRFGATTFVIDNIDELKKLTSYRERIGILLRVSFRSESAVVDLSKKFGCTESEVFEIISAAENEGLHIKGLSFHVGSQCASPDKQVEAIESCCKLMTHINKTAKAPLATLDIGGGFPSDYDLSTPDINDFTAPIRRALDKLPNDWHLIMEPGRFLVAPAVTSITTILGKSIRGGVPWYYLDDGVYGSFSGQIFDKMIYPLQVFKEGETKPSVLAGPTCDSIDIIAEGIELPDLAIGDLVIGHRMGAYTAATCTRFNSLPDAKFVTLQ